jgi:predicted CXXCH cytochrome family protein
VRRLTILLVGGAIWLFLLAIPAFADAGPHIKGQYSNTPAECAGCHRAHTASAAYLLKQPMPDLCYACHGAGANGSVLDAQDGAQFGSGVVHVAGAPAGTFSGALRGGGFEYALINTADQVAGGRNTHIGVVTAGVATTSAHSVDGSAVTMWGQGPYSATEDLGITTDLTCGSCHNPHGNGQYRILNPTPTDASGAVYVNDVTSKIYTTSDYGQYGTYNSNDSQALNADGSSINYQFAASTGRAANSWKGTYAEVSSQWCSTCHTRYMGFRGSAGNLSAADVNGTPWPGTAGGTGDAVWAYKHAVRNLVDPNNPNAPTSGTLTPILTGDGIRPGAVLGCYNSGSGADLITYRGVAVLLGASADPLDCASNATGMQSGSTGRPAWVTLSSGAPRCITCHLSHGSPAVMDPALIGSQTSPGIELAGTPTLDSTLLRLNNRGACMACHNQNN